MEGKTYCHRHDPDARKAQSNRMKGNQFAAIPGYTEEQLAELATPGQTINIAAALRRNAFEIQQLKFKAVSEMHKQHEEKPGEVDIYDLEEATRQYDASASLAVRTNESYHTITKQVDPRSPLAINAGDGATVNILNVADDVVDQIAAARKELQSGSAGKQERESEV